MLPTTSIISAPSHQGQSNIALHSHDHSWSTHLKKVDGADCVPEIQRLGDR
jgi:hypothetical protein